MLINSRHCIPLRTGRQMFVWWAWVISFFTLVTIFLTIDEIQRNGLTQQNLEESSYEQYRFNRIPQSFEEEVERRDDVQPVKESSDRTGASKTHDSVQLPRKPNEGNLEINTSHRNRRIVWSKVNLKKIKMLNENDDDEDYDDVQLVKAAKEIFESDETRVKSAQNVPNRLCTTVSQCNMRQQDGILLKTDEVIRKSTADGPQSRHNLETDLLQDEWRLSRRVPDDSRVPPQSRRRGSAGKIFAQQQVRLLNNKHNGQKQKAAVVAESLDINSRNVKLSMIDEQFSSEMVEISSDVLEIVTPSVEPSILSIETQIQTKDDVAMVLASSPYFVGAMVEPPATQIQIPDVVYRRSDHVVTAWSSTGMPLVEDRVFWTTEVEQLVPKGVTDEALDAFVARVSSTEVSSMEPAEWNRCGRPKNQFLLLHDGTALCARYRAPETALLTCLRGEVLSFYLARMLSLDNVPPVVLSVVNSSALQWRSMDFTRAEWQPGQLVVLIQWIDDLSYDRSRVKMPSSVLDMYETGGALMGSSLANSSLTAIELSALVQWSDLILFDYLTGHYDRVASMQDGAEREMKPSIMTESIRNLRQVWQTGKLWLIDNESGLLDGYELMYRSHPKEGQFISFHRRMLRTICLFRRSTVEGIRLLADQSNPDKVLEEFVTSREPLYRNLPWTPEVELFRRYFSTRLKEVSDWIADCQTKR